MTVTIRHGGESHFVRPDRVYRTSVLQPIVGYSPDNDVQAVTQAFVMGPVVGTILPGDGLSGPFATGWGRIKAWFHSKFGAKHVAAAQAAAITAATAASVAAGNGAPQYGGGPEPTAAQQVAPQIANQMRALMRLTPNGGTVIQQAGHTLAKRRLATYYKAG